MSKPNLTPSQIAQMEAERDKAIATKALFDSQIPTLDARKAELKEVDDGYKAQFDWYNNDVIGYYDAEKKALSGIYQAEPIVEADIQEPASLNGGHRTSPTPPATDIVRIAEFDGGNTTTTEANEQQHIIDQANTEDILKNGISGTVPIFTVTSLTNSALDSSSTTLNMLDAVGPMSFVIGDVFIVYDGTNAAVVEVTGVTDNLGGDPPYDITLDINIILAPANTILSGANITAPFGGFSNAERTSKTATTPNLQPLMDSLIVNLETQLNNRKTRLTEQIAALNSNDDPDGGADIAIAITNANTSDSFITTYLITTDISDVGLNSLLIERTARDSQITTRLGQINAAYTGQTENYYDRRYSLANDRGNVGRGSLRLYLNSDTVKTTAEDMAQTAQDTIDSLNAILP